jgi:hypothetical protein
VEGEGGAVVAVHRGDDGRPVFAAVRDPVGVWFALAQA